MSRKGRRKERGKERRRKERRKNCNVQLITLVMRVNGVSLRCAYGMQCVQSTHMSTPNEKTSTLVPPVSRESNLFGPNDRNTRIAIKYTYT